MYETKLGLPALKKLSLKMKIIIGILLLLTLLTVEGSRSSLCTKKDKSCTDQLWNNGSEAGKMCYMTYYKLNSAKCAALNFQYKTDEQQELGSVRLNAYITEEFKQLLFSINFTNIKWKKAMMRFSTMGIENEKNMCRMFDIWPNVTVPKSSTLTYDCPWSLEDYEGKDYAFEYEFSIPVVIYKKIIFKVPLYKHFNTMTNISSLQIFSYLDVTDSEYLHLYIQTASPKYNISGYLVEVIRERSNISTRLTVQILNVKEAINGQLTFLYPTWNEFGYFYFNVSPINDVCKENECLKTSTPKIFMGRKKSSLVIGIVGASVILFALFYAMFFWNRKKNNQENSPPRALLVYNASLNAHCNVVSNLARLLNELLHVEILLDVLNIPLTNHKDPLLWCSHAFTYATHIIYVASPEVSPLKTKSDNIYKIYGAALKFIKRELVCTHSTKQIIIVTLPYSLNAVPPELTNLKRFNLMKDMDNFISALVTPPYQSWTFLQIYRPNRFRGEPQYIDLMESIHSAQKEVEMLSACTSPNNQTPKITVTENNADNLAVAADDDDVSEDERMLLQIEENCNFRLSDLDLSGHASVDQQPAVTPTHDCTVDLQSWPL